MKNIGRKIQMFTEEVILWRTNPPHPMYRYGSERQQPDQTPTEGGLHHHKVCWAGNGNSVDGKVPAGFALKRRVTFPVWIQICSRGFISFTVSILSWLFLPHGKPALVLCEYCRSNLWVWKVPDTDVEISGSCFLLNAERVDQYVTGLFPTVHGYRTRALFGLSRRIQWKWYPIACGAAVMISFWKLNPG